MIKKKSLFPFFTWLSIKFSDRGRIKNNVTFSTIPFPVLQVSLYFSFSNLINNLIKLLPAPFSHFFLSSGTRKTGQNMFLTDFFIYGNDVYTGAIN
jgi:hypothetical protein